MRYLIVLLCMALPEQYTPQTVQFRSEVERIHEAFGYLNEFGSRDLASMFGEKDEGRMLWRGQHAKQARIMTVVDGLLFDLEFRQGPPTE